MDRGTVDAVFPNFICFTASMEAAALEGVQNTLIRRPDLNIVLIKMAYRAAD